MKGKNKRRGFFGAQSPATKTKVVKKGNKRKTTEKKTKKLTNRQEKRQRIKPSWLEFSDKDCHKPVMVFSAKAYCKMRKMAELATFTEIGGFGISKENDMLYVEDVSIVEQNVSGASCNFTDEGVADHFDEQVDEGRKPNQFARIWIHSHPGKTKPSPSGHDEITFKDCFGKCNWSAMVIFSSDASEVYCRLHFKDPEFDFELPVDIDWKSVDLKWKDENGWADEFKEKVTTAVNFGGQTYLDYLDKKPDDDEVPPNSNRIINGDNKRIITPADKSWRNGTELGRKLYDLNLDPDIDIDEFVTYCLEYGQYVGNMTTADVSYWQNEFRKDKENNKI